MTELVERLRWYVTNVEIIDANPVATAMQGMIAQAADRIEQLENDNIGLQIALDKCIDLGSYEIAQARIERLEGALKDLLDGTDTYYGKRAERARACLKVEP